MSKSLNELRDEALDTATSHGFNEAKILEDVALMHSELSELAEDVRNGAEPTDTWHEFKLSAYDFEGKPITDRNGKHVLVAVTNNQQLGKPCGIPVELADLIIRALHFAGKHNIDIQAAINEKLAFNRTRPYRHNKVI